MSAAAAEPADELLTTSQVAELAGVSIPTVIRATVAGRLAHEQKLPGLRGAYLYRRAAVDAYLARARA